MNTILLSSSATGGWRAGCKFTLLTLAMTGWALVVSAAQPDPSWATAVGSARQKVIRLLPDSAGRGQPAPLAPAAAEPGNSSPGEETECRAVHRYFPLHDGDYGEFMLPGFPLPGDVISTTLNGRPALLARGFAQGGFGNGCYYSYDGDELLLLGMDLDDSTLVFSPPLVELDSQLALSGGTRTSKAIGTYEGISSTISYTITVQEAGTVSVEAGTFANCRRVNVIIKATVPGQKSGTGRQSYILAPGVGKIRILLPEVSSAWMEMVEGTIDGEQVWNLEEQSLIRSPRFTTQPSNLQKIRGLAATFNVVVDGDPPLNYQWIKDGTSLTNSERVSGANTTSLVIHQVEPEDAGQYSVKMFNESGCADSLEATLTVLPDTTRPTLQIVTPPANARLSNALVTIRGNAGDNACVTRVRCQLNDGEWAEASGTTNWTASFELRPGTNLFHAEAVDLSGNVSLTTSRTLIYVLTSPLRLTVQGDGTVGPLTDGQLLEIGRGYTLTATPAPGNAFSNWVGDVPGSSQTLTFTMASNLVVVANFVPNPFLGLQGAYQGLFHDGEAPAHVNAGAFMLTVTDRGTYSGRLQQGATRLSIRGQFNLALATQTAVGQPATGEFTIGLQLAAGSDQVTGSVSHSGWTSGLFGHRATYSKTLPPPTNRLGSYTVLLPGAENPADGPVGNGWARLAVSRAGLVTCQATLGDSTGVVLKGPLAAGGEWPLYASLAAGRGSIFGWLTVSDTPTNDVHGLLLWTKPGGVKGAIHPAGFTNEVQVMGSHYVAPPAGTRALDLTNAVVALAGGNLPGPLISDVVLSEFNQITVASPNAHRLTLRLTASSGQLTGSFTHPQTGRSTSLKGILLPKQDLGGGCFNGTNESGSFLLFVPGD